jgi:hypothetical protein
MEASDVVAMVLRRADNRFSDSLLALGRTAIPSREVLGRSCCHDGDANSRCWDVLGVYACSCVNRAWIVKGAKA